MLLSVPDMASLRDLLTPMERHCLAACYSDGRTAEDVADSMDKTGRAVRRAIERAANKLAAAGYPRPRPYGRERLRPCVPSIRP